MKLPFSKFLTAAITVAGMVAPAPAQPVSQNMELMGAIAREIVNSGEPQGVDWVEVSAIFSIDADGDVNGSYGYVYDARGRAHAAAFLEDPIEREVKAYRDWLLHKGRKGDKSIIKMLFQFNRQTRRVRADFEYEDPRRWQITPANLDARVKELRRHLGTADGK